MIDTVELFYLVDTRILESIYESRRNGKDAQQVKRSIASFQFQLDETRPTKTLRPNCFESISDSLLMLVAAIRVEQHKCSGGKCSLVLLAKCELSERNSLFPLASRCSPSKSSLRYPQSSAKKRGELL